MCISHAYYLLYLVQTMEWKFQVFIHLESVVSLEHCLGNSNVVLKRIVYNISGGILYCILTFVVFSVPFSWFQGLFPPGQGATIGVDFMIKTVEIKGVKVKVCCWLMILDFFFFMH